MLTTMVIKKCNSNAYNNARIMVTTILTTIFIKMVTTMLTTIFIEIVTIKAYSSGYNIGTTIEC